MKKFIIILLFSSLFLLQFCTTTKKVPSTTKTDALISTLSYENDIKPIMVNHCTPCHFPEKGQKKMLDTYEAVSDNIYDIITRVKLTPDDIKFMPYKSKKEPLSDSLVNVFVQWNKQKMPK